LSTNVRLISWLGRMYLLREKILSSISSIKNERCCVIVFPNFHFSHVCYCPKKKTPKKTELKNAAEREMLFSSSSIVSRSNTLLSVSQNSCRPKGKKTLKIKQEENSFQHVLFLCDQKRYIGGFSNFRFSRFQLS